MEDKKHFIFKSVTELHSLMGLKKPSNPLISVVNLSEIEQHKGSSVQSVVYDFYTILLKKNCEAKIRYGQQYYDFDSGAMTFYAPKQKVIVEEYSPTPLEGWMLVFHPDFLQGHSLATSIRDYGFFNYAANEALHLSDKEETVISSVIENLQQEIDETIDVYTQDVVLSHIELLLNYSNRFYNRQFITRKKVSNDLLATFEELLTKYFQKEQSGLFELPTAQYFADELFVTPHYLNDMLKNVTGQTTQQHIQNHLVEKAKELLSTTNLSVGEIAYQLGYEYPQSFSRFFKKETAQSPSEFRRFYN